MYTQQLRGLQKIPTSFFRVFFLKKKEEDVDEAYLFGDDSEDDAAPKRPPKRPQPAELSILDFYDQEEDKYKVQKNQRTGRAFTDVDLLSGPKTRGREKAAVCAALLAACARSLRSPSSSFQLD